MIVTDPWLIVDPEISTASVTDTRPSMVAEPACIAPMADIAFARISPVTTMFDPNLATAITLRDPLTSSSVIEVDPWTSIPVSNTASAPTDNCPRMIVPDSTPNALSMLTGP